MRIAEVVTLRILQSDVITLIDGMDSRLATPGALRNQYPMHRVLLVSLILLCGGARAVATEWPQLSGGLSGDFRMRALSGAPPIQWQLETTDSGQRENRLSFRAHTNGLAMRVVVVLPRDGSVGRWEILDGRLDVSQWWTYLAKSGYLKGMPGDLKLTGEVLLAGQGTLKGAQPEGEITFTLADGSIGSIVRKWSVPHLTMEGRMTLADAEPVIDSLRLTAPRAEVLGFVLERIEASAMGEAPQQLRVLEIKVAVLGGRIEVQPFALDLQQPAIAAIVELQDVALSELAALVPEALSEAQGRLSGALEIGWSASMGVQAGKGSLQLSKDTATTLRLAATPGFLTQHAPKKTQWLPAMMGSLAQWLALDNPAFETLRKIEMGEMGLTVDTLDVALYPDGPDGAVSARVAVSARPSEGSFVEEVSFDVSVTGPLKDVLLLSADERVKIGVKSQ